MGKKHSRLLLPSSIGGMAPETKQTSDIGLPEAQKLYISFNQLDFELCVGVYDTISICLHLYQSVSVAIVYLYIYTNIHIIFANMYPYLYLYLSVYMYWEYLYTCIGNSGA